MTVMLGILAAWVAFSLIVGLTVGRAIRQADSAEFPTRRAEWWVTPTAATAEDTEADETGQTAVPARSERVSHAA